jgi:hypothetical protein
VNESTEVPSRVSIAGLAALAALILVAAFWVLFAPEDQYTNRHVVGYIMGQVLGLEVALQAVQRGIRRAKMLEAARHEQPQALRFERDDEVDSDAR